MLAKLAPCDVSAVPDPENLEKIVRESFAELCQTAKRIKPTTGAVEAPKVKAGRSKRVRPQAEVPVTRKRVQTNAQIPLAAKPKRMRKIVVTQEPTASVEPAPVPARPVESEEKEQKALAVGA